MLRTQMFESSVRSSPSAVPSGSAEPGVLRVPAQAARQPVDAQPSATQGAEAALKPAFLGCHGASAKGGAASAAAASQAATGAKLAPSRSAARAPSPSTPLSSAAARRHGECRHGRNKYARNTATRRHAEVCWHEHTPTSRTKPQNVYCNNHNRNQDRNVSSLFRYLPFAPGHCQTISKTKNTPESPGKNNKSARTAE